MNNIFSTIDTQIVYDLYAKAINYINRTYYANDILMNITYTLDDIIPAIYGQIKSKTQDYE